MIREGKLIKTEEELKVMEEGGHIAALILGELSTNSKVGVSTKDLDDLMNELCRKYKVIPATLGYMGFPASFCACVNDVVVHGIPSKDEILKSGDVFTIDLVIKHKGLHLDTALTVPIGDVSEENMHFINSVKTARDLAIKKVAPGVQIGDISAIMEFVSTSNGYSPVREMVGHGIGYFMHEDPEIPCYGRSGTGMKLIPGMTIAIEAIIAKGEPYIQISKKDGWTAKTKDGSISAVFEHTLAVTKSGYKILTI